VKGSARPSLRVYGVSDGLKYSQVFCVAEDRDGMIWAGTSYGVSRYDGRKFESLTSRDGLPHDSVSALAVTGDGTVWLDDGSLFLVIERHRPRGGAANRAGLGRGGI